MESHWKSLPQAYEYDGHQNNSGGGGDHWNKAKVNFEWRSKGTKGKEEGTSRWETVPDCWCKNCSIICIVEHINLQNWQT